MKAFQTGGLEVDLEKKEWDFFFTADREQTMHRVSDEHTLPAWSTGTAPCRISMLTSFHFIQLQNLALDFTFYVHIFVY